MAIVFDAQITVNSSIDNLDEVGLPQGDPEINIYTVDGFLRDCGDCINISYNEMSENGKTFCDITVFQNNRIVIKRLGESESNIEFCEGEESRSIYRVPPYEFDMTVFTKKVRSAIGRHGGDLQLIYSMNIGGQNKNIRIKISVKTK